MKTIALILLAVLTFGCATTRVIAPHIVLWTGATADLVTTIGAVRHGAVESGPVLGQSPVQETLVMGGFTTIVELLARRDRRTGAITRYLGGAMHFGLASWNYHLTRPR